MKYEEKGRLQMQSYIHEVWQKSDFILQFILNYDIYFVPL